MRPCLLALFAALTCHTAFAAPSLPNCFLGRWRSDEALTLADMRSHPEVTQKARALFEKQFFGKLVVVFGSRVSGHYLEPEQGPADMVFEPLDIVSATETSVVLRRRLLGVWLDSEMHCEGGRLWVHVSRWQFREWFSPE